MTMEPIKERILSQDELLKWLSNSYSDLKDYHVTLKHRFKCLQLENRNLLSRLEKVEDYDNLVAYIQVLENVLTGAGMMNKVDRITKNTDFVRLDRYQEMKKERDRALSMYFQEKSKNETYESKKAS